MPPLPLTHPTHISPPSFPDSLLSFPHRDLFTLTSKYDQLEEDWARFYTMEAVLAIESLHSRNYVHRDVKPDNLMIDASGHVKLADFGSTALLNENGYGLMNTPPAPRALFLLPPPPLFPFIPSFLSCCCPLRISARPRSWVRMEMG